MNSSSESPLGDTRLTLIFTGGTSLATWAVNGSLEREAAIYVALSKHLHTVRFLTYGGSADRAYEDSLGQIQLLPSRWSRSAWLSAWIASHLYGAELADSHVFKTNQIRGSDVAIRLRQRHGGKLVVRCGYLWSSFAQREARSRRHVEAAWRAEKRAFTAADRAVVATERDREHVADRHGVEMEKLDVIPNYVDTDLFAPTDGAEQYHAPTILSVGRLVPQKNLGCLLDALTILKERGWSQLCLRLIGSGPLESVLRRTCEARGLNVDFLGNVRNAEIAAVMSTSHLFVLPSNYEGHPKALLEAMSCGMACIGTNVEGIREVIQHGETGVLCEPDEESLAAAIQDALDSPEERQRLGAAARSFAVAHYSLRHVLQMEMRLLVDLLRS